MGTLFSLVGLGCMGAFFTIASKGLPDNKPLIHFSTKPAAIPVRKEEGSDEVAQVSFRTLVETSCKSLYTEFKPIWWLPKFVLIPGNGCHD